MPRFHTFFMIAAAALASGLLAAWLVGGAIIAPAPRTLAKPADLRASDDRIPSADHAVAAWQIDGGPASPVVILAPLLLAQLDLRLGITPAQLEPIRSISKVGAPVLVVGGSRDEHTTAPETRRMFAAASQPKELWIVEGARHEDLFAFDRAAYEAHVLPFLDRYLEGR